MELIYDVADAGDDGVDDRPWMTVEWSLVAVVSQC